MLEIFSDISTDVLNKLQYKFASFNARWLRNISYKAKDDVLFSITKRCKEDFLIIIQIIDHKNVSIRTLVEIASSFDRTELSLYLFECVFSHKKMNSSAKSNIILNRMMVDIVKSVRFNFGS